jgi:hypothetical protein
LTAFSALILMAIFPNQMVPLLVATVAGMVVVIIGRLTS